MTQQLIEEGDSVRHKGRLVNGGLEMTVRRVEGSNAECTHFTGADGTAVDEWFPFEHLEIVRKAEGGFF